MDDKDLVEQIDDLEDEFDENCPDGDQPKDPVPVPVPVPACKKVATAAFWATVGTALYWIISEGTRLFPPRNLILVP